MCGRYTLRQQPEQHNDTGWNRMWSKVNITEPRFNIGPHPIKTAPALLNLANGQLSCESMLFGFKPDWAKSNLINAKSEGLQQSKFWKPLAAMRPCLIPADGFYEPFGESSPSKGKQPVKRPWYGFEFKDHSAFFMAGMWKPVDGKKHFVILTREPADTVASIHARMPVIFTDKQVAEANLWMNTSETLEKRIAAASAPIQHDSLISFPVSDKAKNMGSEGKLCFEAINTLI